VQLRYVGIETTFDAICELFPGAQSEDERKKLLDVAERLAQQNLDVWKKVGPYVQTVLVQRIRDLPEDNVDQLRPVILEVLGKVLSTELRGVSSTYNAMTIHSGSAQASDALIKVRAEALDILMKLYRSASCDGERLRTERTIFHATATPSSAGYSKELLTCVLNDSVRVVNFCREIALGEAYEVLQKAENRIFWLHRRAQGLRIGPNADADTVAVAERLSESIRLFRSAIDANKQFATYKTLVGYDSVFPPMWEDSKFGSAKVDAYRKQRIDELVARVNSENAEEWFATIQRCAKTESDDLATFPSFGLFLQKLSRAHPSIVLGFVERLDKRLTGFLGLILSGLAESDHRAEMEAKISQWLSEDRYLVQIAHYFRFAPKFDNVILTQILKAGFRLNDDDIVAQVLATVFTRYKDGTAALIEAVILPGIEYFTEKRDTRWVNLAWYIPKETSPLAELTTAQTEIILRNLVCASQIDTHAEWILAMLANANSERVFRFFGERLKFSTANEDQASYEAIPYEFYELRTPFSKLVAYAVDAVREWFVSGDSMFQFTGGRLISSSFPEFPDALRVKLSSYLRPHVREEVEFVIRILSAYRGEPSLYETCKEIVRALPTGDDLLSDVEIILQSTDVVSGEFGLVEAYKGKREALVPWLSDEDSKVRSFAELYIGGLDSQIAAEQRRSEERLEMRKRMYDKPAHEDD